MSHLKTAYYDLLGIMYIITSKGNKKFPSVPVYTLARNACLIIYQIYNDILKDTDLLDNDYKKIRNKVHLYQKKNNKKVYKEISHRHVAMFGDDIDNLGFYLEGGELVGSTVYPSYIFYDTTFLESDEKDKMSKATYQFAEQVGVLSRSLLLEICELSNGELSPVSLPSLLCEDLEDYETKDTLWGEVFTDDENYNVAVIRLLLIQQEIASCIWLKKVLEADQTSNMFHKYILLRQLSISLDEIMDNLMNLQKHLGVYFQKVDESCDCRVSHLIHDYEVKIQKECQVLRNMIHYSESGVNFCDYLQSKLGKEPQYADLMIHAMAQDYLQPLSVVLSRYFDIENKRSMSDLEKIMIRLRTKFLKN